MANLKFITCLSVIFAIHLVNPVSTTSVEGITGAYRAEPSRFTYQVGIIVKQNNTYQVRLICNGGIITENLILSSARCFVNNDGSLRNYEYWIVTDKIYWRSAGGVEELIDVIYLPEGGNYFLNDIAVAKLEVNLDMKRNPNLSKLKLPTSDKFFFDRIGIVTGFGDAWVVYEILHETGGRQRIYGWSDDYLRYAEVAAVNHTLCSVSYKKINLDKQFCGIIIPEDITKASGICENDIGSPLVIENTIIGLAGMSRPDCDDTIFGSPYTKVTSYSNFINAIIDGKPLPGTVVHHNRKIEFSFKLPKIS